MAPVEKLLAVAEELAGVAVSIVAIDMPLATGRITSYRESDRAVSRAFARAKCATHTPNENRPGAVSEHLRNRLEAGHFSLRLTEPILAPALIEVYPHPALVRLCRANERLKYKYSKRYEKAMTPAARIDELAVVWRQIVSALADKIDGIAEALVVPEPENGKKGRSFKAFEDRLDAVICAWVGICALEGCAEPYGDDFSAIWIPTEEAVAAADPR